MFQAVLTCQPAAITAETVRARFYSPNVPYGMEPTQDCLCPVGNGLAADEIIWPGSWCCAWSGAAT